MIEEHLEQLKSRLELAAGLPDSTKAELLNLVERVRSEAGVSSAETEGAATEGEDSSEGGLGKLMASVDELEASHPELAASINQVASTLARMGI